MAEKKIHPGKILHSYINDDDILVTPGAYDAFSAKLIELSGFEAAFLTGYGMSASLLGQTDASFTNLTDVAAITRNATRTTQIPIVVDADTGFGNAVNAAWTIRTLSESGAAGATLEDQVFPKSCALEHSTPVIETNEMIGKIRAAIDYRQNSNFVICARTDALAIEGINGVVRRGEAYRNAGAEVIFVSTPTNIDLETISKITHEINCPIHIVLPEGTTDATITVNQLHDIGVAWTTIPLTPMFAAANAILETLKNIRESPDLNPAGQPNLMSFADFQSIVGSDHVRQLEQQYGESSYK